MCSPSVTHLLGQVRKGIQWSGITVEREQVWPVLTIQQVGTY